ncbi:MAG: hypothetical protein WD294_08715 [Phycisphaeraceae bacterium]
MSAVAALLAVASVVGCGPFSPPMPDATVERVELVEVGEEAASYRLHLAIDNAHDEPLPLTLAAYTLTVDGVTYTTDTVPDATLPSQRRLTLTLPGVTENGGRVGSPYQAQGSLIVDPPGQVRQFFYEMGVPRPRIRFTGEGTVE